MMLFFQKNWTDRQLIEAIQAGGRAREAAWKHIYYAWRSYYLKPVLQRGGHADAVDEVFAGVSVAVEKQWIKPDFQLHSASLKTYFTQALLRKWMEQNARKRPSSLDPEQALAHLSTADAESDYLQTERATQVQQALTQTGERCKHLLTMYATGFKMEEIAREAGFENTQSAKNKVAKCRAHLRSLLAPFLS